MSETILSVSEFVELVNQTLEFAYQGVVVEGEVAEYEIKQSKWIHFRLKDADSSVECFMTVWQLRLPIEDGVKLKIVGLPKVTKWGRFSLTIQAYELAGAGALAKAYELLKQQLTKEGLFAPERKRELPIYPQSIGLITSIESEAYNDFMKILNERWVGAKVQVLPVQVQGLASPDQIVAAINWFNQLPRPVDVLVITRGGGSAEDLQAFSSELVVRAVAGSRTPTLVGVGHEGDISLADLAADVRASTPTDAARKVVPNQTEVLGQIASHSRQLQANVSQLISQSQQELNQYVLALDHFVRRPVEQLVQNANRLAHWLVEAAHQLKAYEIQVTEQQRRLHEHVTWQLRDTKHNLDLAGRMLRSMDPVRALKRGYAIVRHRGAIIKSAQRLKVGDPLMIQLAQDQLTTEYKRADPV